MSDVRNSLEQRRVDLQSRIFADGRTDMAEKAFSVLGYLLEGVDDVLSYLISGDSSGAFRQQMSWTEPDQHAPFPEWAEAQIASFRDTMKEHWSERLSKTEYRDIHRWFDDFGRLVSDSSRLEDTQRLIRLTNRCS